MVLSESILSLLAGALSTVLAFILGYKKQTRAAHHQFLVDNEKFRKEVLALVEVEKKNNSELFNRVAALEKQIEELKELNHQQALKHIKDAAENSRLMLLVEKHKMEAERIKNQSAAQVKKIAELEENIRNLRESCHKETETLELKCRALEARCLELEQKGS